MGIVSIEITSTMEAKSKRRIAAFSISRADSFIAFSIGAIVECWESVFKFEIGVLWDVPFRVVMT